MTSGLVVIIKVTLNLYSVTPVGMSVGVLTNLEMWSQDQDVYHKNLSVAITTLTLYKVKLQKDHKPQILLNVFLFSNNSLSFVCKSVTDLCEIS